VPFVHQLMRHLGRYVEPRPWYTVGEAYDPADAPPAAPGARPVAGGAFTAVSPSGHAVEPTAGNGTRTVPLTETGFYEIRRAGSSVQPIVVAVDGAVAESDLAPLDPAALLSNVTPAGTASGGAVLAREMTVEERERHQSFWWYLLVVGLLLLVVEAVVASRLPRIA